MGRHRDAVRLDPTIAKYYGALAPPSRSDPAPSRITAMDAYLATYKRGTPVNSPRPNLPPMLCPLPKFTTLILSIA